MDYKAYLCAMAEMVDYSSNAPQPEPFVTICTDGMPAAIQSMLGTGYVQMGKLLRIVFLSNSSACYEALQRYEE